MTPPMRGLPACCRLCMFCLPALFHAHLKVCSASVLRCCNLSVSTPSCFAWCRFFSHLPPWGLAHWAATAPRAVAVHLSPSVYFARSPENFCGFFLRTCLGILHCKMIGIFGEFFLVCGSHEMKHEKSSKISGKIRSKIRGKIRDKNSKNSGNFRSATFLT